MDEKWHRDLWFAAMWEDENVKPNERVVAYAYSRFAGRGELSWCAWAELRRRTGIKSKDAIWRAIRGLVDTGWLKQEESPRQHRSAVYRLTVPVDNSSGVRLTDPSEVRETDSWNPEVRETAPEVRETGARGPGNRDQRSVKRDTREVIDLSEERSEERTRVSARGPSGARTCVKCNGSGWVRIGVGQLDECECRWDF